MNEALGLREEDSKPLEIENIKKTIERLLKGFYKLSDIQKRRMMEQIFEKVVIKRSQSICLHIYDDVCLDRKDSTPGAAILLDDVSKVRRREDTLPTRMKKDFLDKGLSLNKMAEKHKCSRSYVKSILSENIEDFDPAQNRAEYGELDEMIIKEVKVLKSDGKSFSEIANDFNRLGIKTKSEKGRWHAKTVRDVYLN